MINRDLIAYLGGLADDAEAVIEEEVPSDLRAGIISLPVVLGIQSSTELRGLFGNRERLDGVTLGQALELLRESSIIERGRAMAAGAYTVV